MANLTDSQLATGLEAIIIKGTGGCSVTAGKFCADLGPGVIPTISVGFHCLVSRSRGGWRCGVAPCIGGSVTGTMEDEVNAKIWSKSSSCCSPSIRQACDAVGAMCMSFVGGMRSIQCRQDSDCEGTTGLLRDEARRKPCCEGTRKIITGICLGVDMTSLDLVRHSRASQKYISFIPASVLMSTALLNPSPPGIRLNRNLWPGHPDEQAAGLVRRNELLRSFPRRPRAAYRPIAGLLLRIGGGPDPLGSPPSVRLHERRWRYSVSLFLCIALYFFGCC